MELAAPNNQQNRRRQMLPWLGMACILVSFVIAVVRLHPTNFFGLAEDDALYFSSAKALAEGKGYLLASFPGTPIATKYPVFYPWILSWVWRWNPSFPANLVDVIAVSVAFGALYLIVAFLFLRRLRGISDWEALLLTAFCALHPWVIFYSGSVLSDIPFAAMALAALLIAERATQREANNATVICCGIFVGFCMLTRVFGVPIALGVLASAFMHRAWRQLLAFCGCVAPFFAALARQVLFPRVAISPASGAAASSVGWNHTWAYYTSYLKDWTASVPNAAILFATLKNNALLLFHAPAGYLLSPSLDSDRPLGRILVAVVTVAIISGILREARVREIQPIHLALPFYVCLTLFWIYPLADRFLIPFLPLFTAGVWLEGKQVLGMARATLTGTRPMTEKVLAVALGVLIFVFASLVALNYVGGTRKLMAAQSKRRAALLREKREAYQWLSRSTAQDARVVAYEDASLYLYSGRTAVRPFKFTTTEFYDPPRLLGDLDHMTDVPRAINADYWVSSPDDYRFEWPDAYAKGQARAGELERVLPLAFRSDKGDVRVYFLGCIQHAEAPSCQSARSVLFPADTVNPTLGAALR